MPLTDHNNKPIPMNGKHPAHDYFGTVIDVESDAYIVTSNEDIVHPLNTERYLLEVKNAQLVRTGEY
ncbi:MAG: hypothetical protein R3267_06030 [Paenisporosarcina sp.]|nr:hypothetical protein [Paenisporosarcina sp.]